MKSRTKCTIVEATGVETIRYEDDDGQEREFDVDYKTYDRTVFTVYEDTSFYDYNGDLEFNEDAVMCGANRTECSGVNYFRFFLRNIPRKIQNTCGHRKSLNFLKFLFFCSPNLTFY